MMLEIGVPPLDSDHRFLMEMLGELESSAARGADAGLLEDQSLEVASSLESHFAKEERMLAEAQDARRMQHIERHGQLLDRLARMTGAELHALGPAGASRAIVDFIKAFEEEVADFDLAAAPAIATITKSG
jgi:hemerythrin-like metal-binding protein